MNPDYQRLRQVADRLYYRFNDVVDDKNAAASLAREVRNVVEDFDQQKKPRSIDDRVKNVIGQLEQIRSSGTAISPSDADDLRDRYEDLRRDLRDLENY